jgi:hypothetical protein
LLDALFKASVSSFESGKNFFFGSFDITGVDCAPMRFRNRLQIDRADFPGGVVADRDYDIDRFIA